MSIVELYWTVMAYGPVLLIAIAVVAIMLYMLVGSLRQARGTILEDAYPPVESAARTRRTRARAVFGQGPRMTWVKVGADDTYLHVRVFGSMISRGSFSVPLSEVTAEAARFSVMILAPDVIRLTFARSPSLPMLVWPHVFAKLSAASGGRLQVPAGGGEDTGRMLR
jgi:hypothetical protein